MSALAATLLADLDDNTLKERLRPLVAELVAEAMPPEPDRWLDSKAAAAHLSLTRHALHKLTAAREIPFEQDGPGCKLWFQRSALDAWRRAETRSAAKNRSQEPRCPLIRLEPELNKSAI